MRGRIGTRLLVAAVLALGGAAIVDAVRGRSETDVRAPALAGGGDETRAEAAAALRDAGVGGRLIYTDERCDVVAVSLPEVVPTARPLPAPEVGCAFVVSPTNQRALAAGSTWSPDGRLLARCRGGTTYVTVASERGFLVRRVPGCAPAWTPNRQLTVVHRGQIETTDRVVVPKQAIYAAARRHPNVPDSPRFGASAAPIQHVWLTTERVAALLAVRLPDRLRGTGAERVAAIFERGRLVATYVGIGGDVAGFERSPNGTYAIAPPDTILRRNGTAIALPEWLRGPRDIAFSPDELWTAIASRDGIYLVRTWELEVYDRAGRPPRSIRIPIVARDLAWR